MKTDLFGYQNQGMNYDIYRPNYPSQMLDKAITVSKDRNSLLDVATGTGKILFHLYPHFKHSKGVDLSQNMIKVCRQKVEQLKVEQKIELKCENFMLAKIDQKYDLVTIGQALHWFPIKDFLIKTKQILNKNGILIVYGYILDRIEGETMQQTSFLSNLWQQFYVKRVKINHDFDVDQLHNQYSDKKRYPFEQLFSIVKRQNTKVTIQMCKDKLLSYVKTFSGYNTYHERHVQQADPLKYLEQIPQAMKINCVFYYFSVVCEP